jgi:hypothetical protein
MFLISGTLIGYSIRDQKDVTQVSREEKVGRKPSFDKIPPFASQLPKPIMPQTTDRIPSDDALLMANHYSKPTSRLSR